jgi:hypothetical protein
LWVKVTLDEGNLMMLISRTIDELVKPDALICTPLPIEATGAALVKEVFARLLRAYPDLHKGQAQWM